ncbi:hypothetical protein [Kitasatospora sp. GAS204B]|nr:hypothetical protein [Kitasatospora sp. GAS204B]MDH6117645.1 hypothetical protein [Kitasatospora sp. GAS204B]
MSTSQGAPVVASCPTLSQAMTWAGPTSGRWITGGELLLDHFAGW